MIEETTPEDYSICDVLNKILHVQEMKFTLTRSFCEGKRYLYS